MSLVIPLAATTYRNLSGAPLPSESLLAEARHDRARTLQHIVEVARQRRPVEVGRIAKTIGQQQQCELSAHAENSYPDL